MEQEGSDGRAGTRVWMLVGDTIYRSNQTSPRGVVVKGLADLGEEDEAGVRGVGRQVVGGAAKGGCEFVVREGEGAAPAGHQCPTPQVLFFVAWCVGG